jgi:hypothetical protein
MVQFRDGSVILGSEPLNKSGVATLLVTNFTVGTHSLTAYYMGTSSFAASTSSVVSEVVNPDPSPTLAESVLESVQRSICQQNMEQILRVSEGVVFVPPSLLPVGTAPTVFSLGVPGSPPASITVPSLLPGGTFTGSANFTVPVPNGFGVFTYPVQVTGGGSSTTLDLVFASEIAKIVEAQGFTPSATRLMRALGTDYARP